MSDVSHAIDDYVGAVRSGARMGLIGAEDEDPEAASRAFELSDATGVPSTAIYGDVEGFERQHKAALSNQIIQNNTHLSTWLNTHPLNAILARDDLASLDAVSEKVNKLGENSVLGKAFEAYKAGVGEEPYGLQLKNEELQQVAESPGWRALYATTQLVQWPYDVLARNIQGGLYAGAAAAGQIYKQLGGNEAMGDRFMRDLIIGGTGALTESITSSFHLHPELQALAKGAQRLGKKVEPWAAAGKEPPSGLDPNIDKLHEEQAKVDVKNLDEALKESQNSSVRQSNPNVFKTFIDQFPDTKVYVSAEAVRKLYGDAEPVVDDNKLGFVSDLAEQLRGAEPVGGDVEIPLREWLAHVDPEVAKELHDDLKIRPGGVTLNEAKAMREREPEAKPEEPKPEVEPEAEVQAPRTEIEPSHSFFDAVDSVRQAAALGPKRTEQLQLKKIREHELEPEESVSAKREVQHIYRLTDETGRDQADLHITPVNNGKTLFVDWIGNFAVGRFGEPRINVYTPAIMRDLIAQLKAEFPQAEKITGYRVSGAREKAGATGPAEVKLHEFDPEGLQHLVDLANATRPEYEVEFGQGVKGWLPTDDWTEHEEQIINKVDEVLDRIVPKGVRTQPVAGAEIRERPVQGAYVTYREQEPLILWALDSENALQTGRHEAIHHLKRYGFFTPKEWQRLQIEAFGEDWLGKYDIDQRYSGLSMESKLEEAIAERYADWATKPEAESALGKIFTKLQDLLHQISEAVREVFGKEMTATDLFRKVERGEIGRREGGEPGDGAFAPRAQEGPFEKPAAVGMTRDQFQRYQRLMEQRNAEDVKRAQKLHEQQVSKRLTQEWKDAAKQMRPEVERDIRARPDILVDAFFKKRQLAGGTASELPKLDPAYLTDEQRKALPKQFMGSGGLNPDDIAGMFGYATGADMVDRMGSLAQEIGRKQHDSFVRELVDAELDRRMEQTHGNLQARILDEAQDHVASPTQMEMLHEELVALGTRVGGALNIDKGTLSLWVQRTFGETKARLHDAAKYLDKAGKAGRAAEDALLKGDAQEAFKAKQSQYLAMLLAREAKKLEKQVEVFDRNAKRFGKRDDARVGQEYVNFIQDLLIRVQRPVQRSIQNIRESIASGPQKSLQDFVDHKRGHDMRELDVDGFLLDPSFNKRFDDLTTEEFRGLHESIKSLIKNGADEAKIEREGEEADLANVRNGIVDYLQRTFEAKPRDLNPGRIAKLVHTLRTGVASLLTTERIIQGIERGDPNGLLTRWVVDPMVDAANARSALERKYSQALSAIKVPKDLKGLVRNPIFRDPVDGTLLPMKRSNMLMVLLNAGNYSNLFKLAQGYKLSPEAVKNWLANVATKEDWEFAQKIGGVFADLKKESDNMYRHLSGREPPEGVPLSPITTPHGTFDGWYYPIIYDAKWEGTSKKRLGGDPLERDAYYRATPSAGYTIQRTGYIAPINLEFGLAGVRMKQIINDIAMRPAAIQAGKIVYDSKIRNEITKRYGEEYKDQLVPWLRDAVNAANFRSEAASVGERVSELIRQNTVAVLIGFNPGTVLKHGPTAAINSITEVGPLRFAKAVATLFSRDDLTGETNWRFAMDTSEELQRRTQHWFEQIGGAEKQVLGQMTMRETMIKLGSTPVAWIDLASAVPTWLASYEKAKGAGLTEGDAIRAGDRSVRFAHGSSAITNLPAAMRGGAMSRWLTSVYGFFNHIFNKYWELGWKSKQAIGLATSGQALEGAKMVPGIAMGVFSYVIMPALIEQWVQGEVKAKDWGKWWAEVLGRGLASSVPILRDMAAGFSEGKDPSIGLAGSAAKMVWDVAKDASSKGLHLDKQHAGNTLKHVITAFGLFSGFTNAQEGRTLDYIQKVATGQEHPKGIKDLARGVWHGTQQPPKTK
jgi:hypothetical protein